ncbi:FAD-binding oxidoreductase [Kibdelosporangium philippinense]|uniref:D-amino-acid oxidase n=1 Tax=Kibdelosporangium philippinense TaxID=211113 RepID=A0ABS8ZWG3_9PSEU|nr:FAD-dependent oxidoreductase [Kibdelosporangium philippinense]MCE7011365.1 FAD-binding oxidoreductase [Kibdelosporangium philippinense]
MPEIGSLSVAIVGGGPIGKWTALMLAKAGASVTIFDDGSLNTGHVNAGWGFAYHSHDPAVGHLATQGIELYLRMQDEVLPPGVVTEEWSTVQRSATAAPFPEGLDELEGYRLLDPADLAVNMVEGVVVHSVVVPGELLLGALDELHKDLGVKLIREHVANPADIPDADFVVNATGLASAWLYNDREFTPSMGTVVRLRKPEGFSGVYAWDDATNCAPYAISQEATGNVVIGGTTKPVTIEEARDWVEAGSPPDLATGEFLVDHISTYLPELANTEYVRTDTGIRPERSDILLAKDQNDHRLIHATGFGGFGVTVAPAVATRILDIVVSG